MSDLKRLRSAIRSRRLSTDAPDDAETQTSEPDHDASGSAELVGATAAPALLQPAPSMATLPRPSVDRADAEARLPALAALDDWQLAAVVEGDNAVVCAAVGSGKTRVLVHKVLWLHLVQGVPLEHLAVVTFTRKAAGEIEGRLHEALGRAPTTDATWLMGTFHGVARALLARALPVAELGFTPAFRVLDATERDGLLHQLIAEHDLDIKHKRRLQARFDALAEGRLRIGNMRRDDDILRLFELYEARKRALDAMDFGDLVVGCGALLPALSPERRPRWLLVDELQDTDDDQLDLLAGLVGEGCRVFAVGDPHQTIYGWRGSQSGDFSRFAERFDARVLRLPCNYRSGARIAQAAEALLVAGRATIDAEAARVVPQRPADQRVQIIRHHDPVAEARWIAESLAARISGGAAPGAYAVLARTRRALDVVADQLAHRGVPVRRAVQREAEREAARWLHALLRATLTADDVGALRQALTDPLRGLCRSEDLRDERLPAGATPRARVVGRLRALAARSKRLDPGLVERLAAGLEGRELLPIDEMLRPTRTGYDADRQLCSALLAAWTARAELLGGGDEGLAGALDEALCDDAFGLEGARASGPSEGVALLSVHAAKGLEFDAVWVIGVNDGGFPLAGAMSHPAALAEEIRLLFVAMTRARDQLELSWVAAPTAPRATGMPSPLLRLLPATTVQWHDHPPTRPAPTAARPSAWPVGSRVRHRKHGEGAVLASDADAVVVRFVRGGERKFATAMMPCERIESD